MIKKRGLQIDDDDDQERNQKNLQNLGQTRFGKQLDDDLFGGPRKQPPKSQQKKSPQSIKKVEPQKVKHSSERIQTQNPSSVPSKEQKVTDIKKEIKVTGNKAQITITKKQTQTTRIVEKVREEPKPKQKAENLSKNTISNYNLTNASSNYQLTNSGSNNQITKKGDENFSYQNYVSQYCSLEDVCQIKKAFDLFDRDMGGSIDPKELKIAINSLGIQAKAQAVYQMIADIDKDGSGQIQFDEFFSMMTMRPSQNQSWDEIHKIFATFDNQRTGYIALKDLRRVAKELGQLNDDSWLQEMIQRADFDRDGLVSEEEFYNLLTKKVY